MNDLIIKMSIISTIQLLNNNYEFNILESKTYSELEVIRDYELDLYNSRIELGDKHRENN